MTDPITPALPDASSRPSSTVAARTVDVGRGAAWWSEAWRLFAAAPGPWLLIVLILLVINVVLLVIPLVGHLAMQLLYPVFAAGLLLGWGWFTVCSIAFGGRLLTWGQPVATAEAVAEVTPDVTMGA